MISSFTPRFGLATLAIAGLTALADFTVSTSTAEEAHKIPPPTVDEPAGAAAPEVAVVAGGCFWGVQGVFQHVDGVVSAVSGYDGGSASTAHYDMTSRGDTGHAESVRIAFDPMKISYGKILQISFRSRTIRPRSIVRVRTKGRNIARRYSRRTASRPGWRRTTSPSSTRGTRSARRS